jgi:drug/metabolite transporter (DMT)-like permease
LVLNLHYFYHGRKTFGALQVNLYRLPLALLLLSITYFTFWGDINVTIGTVAWLSASGIVGLAIGDTFLFQAMVKIVARLSMVLLSLAPPITAISAYLFLNESISFFGIIGIGTTVLGVIWVVAERIPNTKGRRKNISIRGLLWGILAALGQAVGLIFAKKGLCTEIHALLATWIRMAGATAILWPLTLLTGKIKNPLFLFKKDRTALKLVVAGTFFGPFLGVTSSLISVKYTHTGIAATLMSTVPVVMIPFLILIEKERPTFRAVMGAAITVIGIAIIFLHK